MGLWSWLFGNKEPDLEEDGNRLIDVANQGGKRHGPYKRYRKDGSLLEEGSYTDGEKHGPFVIHGRDVRIEGTYRTGKLHGLHRVLKPDGSVQEEREYDDGEVVRGPHEKRDEIHKDWVRERGTMVHGKRDGVWREYGIPRDDKKPLMKRCEYKDGVLDGAYETWFYDGTREIEGAYRADKRVGRWVFSRHDGSTQAEVDYEDGVLATWRWLARDGAERGRVEVTDDDDLARWLALGDAWDDHRDRGTYGIEMAIDRWPAERRAPALAWLDARILSEGRPKVWSAGNEWLDLMADLDEIDPRTRYVDSLELDHHEFNEDQVRRLQRFAPQILQVSMHECVVPDASMFFDVPWPKLVSLFVHESGPVDNVVGKLHASPIEELSLTYESLGPTAIHELVNAPWFATLQLLRLTVEDRTIIDVIANAAMPELRDLEIECHELELGASDATLLVDRELRPTLERLWLNDTDYSAMSTK